MDLVNIIQSRRSVREYKKDIPKDEDIQKILEAGRWSPSGLNNQPWKFLVLQGEAKDALASFTTSGEIIRQAPVVIVVCLDKKACYHRDKDLMALGACIQNMLLEAYALGLGTCWLGEILNKQSEVAEHLKLRNHLEFMAVVSVGYPSRFPIKISKAPPLLTNNEAACPFLEVSNRKRAKGMPPPFSARKAAKGKPDKGERKDLKDLMIL